MSFIRIGQILIDQGLITQSQLDKAIEIQSNEGGRLGEIMVRLGVIVEEDITAALGQQLGIPYYTKRNAEIFTPKTDQGLQGCLTGEFCRKNNVVPLSRTEGSLLCAISDPLDLLLIDNIKRVSGLDINLAIAPVSVIQEAVSRLYFASNVKDPQKKESMLEEAVSKSYSSLETVGADDAQPGSKSDDTPELSMDKLIEKAEEAPVIKLVDLIIRQAIDERASDIHIEPFHEKIHLRYRIDGNLYEIPPPSPHLHVAIVSRIKILSKLDIAEKRLPQDGAISAKLEGRIVDIRVSTVPTVWGEKVVMRILDKEAVPLELASLGFDSRQVAMLRKALSSPYGLFFVTGPTGSGKSTSLYAAVNETIDPTKNIMTAEDPVEYKIEGINQVSVRSDIGLTFATSLKAFLRQDPDVIMVGETRDLETASICVRAALTGHFVLSTLHTNDAASAITRLIDIGIPNYLLTPSLVMIMAQRLARKLCPKCKEAYESTPAEHGGVELNADLVYRAMGCEECNNTGYKGRIVVAEVLLVEKEMRTLISQSASHAELKDCARKNGMTTIFESGLRLVEKGITSYDEVCRVSVEEV